ncbi:DNA helicase [Bradyrhizobium brasilense]|uniref:Z1 domain-containing protein n=1 Tax=Bradyrhizobium brasilense TaxID=1419277 RepID=UPI002877CE46|nr:Z1 domain-containing protein [Bradyrhizobium brasilense]MCP3417924.1 DNA helicase [Bradyrhizobium brasilense]
MALNVDQLKGKSKLKGRYAKQLARLQAKGIKTDCIEKAVEGAVANLKTAKKSSLIIYGDPQSGKTEMMICLTAKLLDDGHKTIVHLMNDSVDLLSQNLKRFKGSGLAPAAQNSSEVLNTSKNLKTQESVIFCKKNGKDLEKLIARLENIPSVVVIDDEADYASPNGKINRGKKTRINNLVGELIGKNGFYAGVTATPARLDLNNTFQNDAEKWVKFPAHSKYTGQDTFFPLDLKKIGYRLKLLNQGGNPKDAEQALIRFLVTAAYLNLIVNKDEQNYSLLVHTSGNKTDHESDKKTIEGLVHSLSDSSDKAFGHLVTEVHKSAQALYPAADADKMAEYVVENISRASIVVLNSERDRVAAGDAATEPTSPFTIIIGGNIVSRGVTFPNLLAMYFTRDVASKLQQDTYIQRARMFGARGEYLPHFELTIPKQLYADWHKCFVFHKLALETIESDLGSPVWVGDSRVSVASKPSINNATVVLDKGELSYQMFDYDPSLESILTDNNTSVDTLRELQKKIGKLALPDLLINYIAAVQPNGNGSLAIHKSSQIPKGQTYDQAKISRDKGVMGKSQLEPDKFPNAVHHVKLFFNHAKKARLFYKSAGSIQFIQNQK